MGALYTHGYPCAPNWSPAYSYGTKYGTGLYDPLSYVNTTAVPVNTYTSHVRYHLMLDSRLIESSGPACDHSATCWDNYSCPCLCFASQFIASSCPLSDFSRDPASSCLSPNHKCSSDQQRIFVTTISGFHCSI